MKKNEPGSLRLRLEPMSDQALEALRDTQTDEGLRRAYTERLEACRRDPEGRLWHTCWSILERTSGARVGDIGFQGPPVARTVTVVCAVDPAHQGNMYAAEALQSLCAWAFGQRGVYFVEARTLPANKAAVWSLEHAEFRLVETLEGVAFWRREKPKSQWLYVCAGLGLAVGGAVGLLLGDLSEGLVTGLCLGLAPGVVLYFVDRRIRRDKGFREKGGLLKR